MPISSLLWIDHTQTDIISKQIAEASNEGAEQTAFLTTVISEFEKSEFRTYMDVAWRYYKNENDIKDAKRMVIGKDANNQAILMESKVLANNKLCHNFMKKLTRQKIGYMLGKPFTLAANKADDKEAEKLFELCKRYFGKDFFKMIKNVGRDSIVKGIGWLLVYYDEQGNLKFMRCAPEEVIPLWADSDHTELDAVIRKYGVEQYTGGVKKIITYVDYYTHEGVYHYVYNESGKLEKDENKTFKSPNFTVKTNGEDGKEQEIGVRWAKIPFIPFKYDPDEQSLLVRIKSLVDDYDKKTSGVANNIDDFPNSTTVVKNYDGASKEEFVHNKNQYRTIFVQGDGDAKSLETPLNIEEVDKHIQRLREDIYEFGQGVNTADKDIRDTSGVALRFLYGDLDMDCIDWGSEVEWSIMLLIWFIQQDLMAKGEGNFTNVEYSVIFNTDMIINETETIQNCFTSQGIISGKTIASNHPWVINAQKEMDNMLSEQTDVLDLEAEYGTKTQTNPAAGQRTKGV